LHFLTVGIDAGIDALIVCREYFFPVKPNIQTVKTGETLAWWEFPSIHSGGDGNLVIDDHHV
jgi:hypothetical protein